MHCDPLDGRPGSLLDSAVGKYDTPVEKGEANLFVMLKKTALFLILILHWALAGSAEQVDYARAYDQCLSEAGFTDNATVSMCASKVSDDVKVEMNMRYDALHARLLDEAQDDADKLERAQKSWLAYRDLHCELMTEYVGSPIYTYCPMQLNIARVQELRELDQ